MTSPNAHVNRKSKPLLSRLVNLFFALLVLCLGPVLIGAGTHQINADEELVRTGEHAPGTIVDFSDVRKASNRKITVEFQSADGLVHVTGAAVDHDQHPVVGEEVTVVYRALEPGDARVVGFESDGVFLRGVGTILTLIFGGIAFFVTVGSLRRARRNRREGIGQG